VLAVVVRATVAKVTWSPSSDAAPERSRPQPIVFLRLPATGAFLDLDAMTDAACSGRESAEDTRWDTPCGPQRPLSFGTGFEVDSLVETGGYQEEAGNQADPMVGCRVQQTCTAHAEQAVEVVRNGKDGTGLGLGRPGPKVLDEVVTRATDSTPSGGLHGTRVCLLRQEPRSVGDDGALGVDARSRCRRRGNL